MKRARDEGRDSIWKFILQNSYKPIFLQHQFDFVVGNPPWLTYADVANADYQGMLRVLADGYGITPGRRNIPHLEIAAIFLAHAINHFMKSNGRTSFVLPRSFMTADQHENTRSGNVENLKLLELWDLKDVEPLFRVPCCVVFARHLHGKEAPGISAQGIPGRIFSGKLPKSHLHWNEAKNRLASERCQWFYSKLQRGKDQIRSAITATPSSGSVGRNPYASGFKQGSSIVPRGFYFVELDEEDRPETLRDRVVHVKTSRSIMRDAKAPWKDVSMSGHVEGAFLFRTVIAKNILPFGIVNPLMVLLPICIRRNRKESEFVLLRHEELLAQGARHASNWFWEVERTWNTLKTEKAVRSEMTYLDRLNFQQGITDQDPNAEFIVMFCRSAQDGNAVALNVGTFDLPFVADFATYWCAVKSMEEGHYLAAYLNSGYTNAVLKDFQTQGLFGARDVTKKIVEIPFPKFDGTKDDHKRLAALGARCAAAVAEFVLARPDLDLDARSLGRVRGQMRDSLAAHLDEIDVIVEKLSTGRTEVAIREKRKVSKRIKPGSGELFE